MPQIGEIKRAFEINLGKHKSYAKYIWIACEKCGKERYVYLYKGKPKYHMCSNCVNPAFSLARGEKRVYTRGVNNHCWKGGRYKTLGYIMVTISPDDFFYPMAGSNGYVAEHRLVMAKSLGRNLLNWEWVHHKNGIRDDNRIDNLELTTAKTHISDHNKGYQDGYTQGLMDGRDKQVQELKEMIRLLRLQNPSNPVTCPLCGLFYTKINPFEKCPRCKGE
jgi:hypothetical protein